MRIRNHVYVAALAIACAPLFASANVLVSDGFDTAGDASNYNVYITAGTASAPSGDATFGYNYGAAPSAGGLSIPVAPHTTDGSTTGLRLRTDNLMSSVGTVVGAVDIATKGLVLPTAYTVSVDVWSNYIGGSNLSASGSNGSTGVAVGVGTSGSSIQYIAANDGMLVEGFGDNGGGTNSDYRLWVNNTHPTPLTSSYYTAGTGANSATNSDPYYTAFLPSVAAPAGQSSFAASTQGGTTAAGTLGFAWHTWTITQDGTNLTWAIDGHTISTAPDSAFTFGGSQVTLGNDDTGLTGNSAANNQLFNAEIFDNFTITTVPEPTTLSLVGLAAVGAMRRRRSR
ncbi:MAG TPA: PEP-CTERM sorting domain-containing protein [Tepidisphaeraceae bacterium]|jgi:hypothetical protein|nr:PEP-CTERM sorting domain-containing protein [Tepidisphaeraceae bacterium]